MQNQAQDIAEIEVALGQLSALVGVSERHCRRLLQDAPQVRRGRWALGSAVAALVDGLSTGPAGGDLTAARTRLVTLQGEREELRLAKEKGDVCLIGEAARAWEQRCGLIRTNILNVPARAVLQLLGCTQETEFKATLRRELVLALQQAASAELTEPDLEDDTDDDENHE